MSSAEHERLLRRARAQDVALFRYRLIGPALEDGLSTKQRGRVVRGIAGQVHAGPGGRGVQVSRKTIDRWIRDWRTGGFDALVPSAAVRAADPGRGAGAGGGAEAGEPGPDRGAGRGGSWRPRSGGAPSERTLQRHFARRGPGGPARGARGVRPVRGRGPNELWTGDALHGPVIGGRKSYLFAFLDDHSRAVMGPVGVAAKTPSAWPRRCARWRPAASPRPAYVDNGAASSMRRVAAAGCASLGIKLIHSPPGRPPLTGQSLRSSDRSSCRT